MSPTGLGPKILLAFVWSCGSMLLLSVVDAIVVSPGPNGGSVGFLLLAVLSAIASLVVLKVAGLAGARAAAFGSLITIVAFVPCMVRAADSPLVLGLLEDREKIYSGGPLLAIGVCVLVSVAALCSRFERQTTTPIDPSKPDYALFAVVGVSALMTGLLVASSIRLPPLTEVLVAQTYAEMTVPPLDSVAVDTIPIFDDGKIRVTATRTEPLPMQVGRLELDLGDGVGDRPVVAVGGGEKLQLLRRGDLVWELCHLPPQRGRDRVSSADRDACVPLARFRSGAAERSADLRVSIVRGSVAPPPGFLVSAAIALVAAVAALAVSEQRRRKLCRIARGQQGTLGIDGTIESLGEHYTLREPPAHRWPGPVVLLDVVEQTSPYRGTRAAGSVVPGTIPQHIAWQSQQRLALRAVVGPALALLIASVVAAGYVGYLGF